MPLNNSVLIAGLIAVCFISPCVAQDVTIGEYSAVQRQVIADEMARARGKVAPVASAASAPAAVKVPVVMAPRPQLPTVRVAGVSIIRQRAAAEITVNGVAYMLEVGDAVPGSPQTVTYVGADRVELTSTVAVAAKKRGNAKAQPEVTIYRIRTR